MQTVREIMTPGCESIAESESIAAAARTMLRLGIGALPIRSSDHKLIGILTDRDIVLKVIAEGKDPASTTAGELASAMPAFARMSDPLDDVIETMSERRVRRIPVLDEDDTLAGLVSLGDIAFKDSTRAGVLLQSIFADRS